MTVLQLEECPACHAWYTSVAKHQRCCRAKDDWPYCSNVECCEYAMVVTASGPFCGGCATSESGSESETEVEIEGTRSKPLMLSVHAAAFVPG